MQTYEIGTKVFYFEDKLKGDLPILEGTVYGAFVSKATGDIYYYLDSEQFPAFCVSDTQEGAEALRDSYKAYAEGYMAKVDEQTAKYNEFKSAWNLPELRQNKGE